MGEPLTVAVLTATFALLVVLLVMQAVVIDSLLKTVRLLARPRPPRTRAVPVPAIPAASPGEPDTQPLMTRAEAAGVLGVSHRKIRRLGAAEVLANVPRAGRETLVTRQSVRAYQEARPWQR